MAGHHDVIGDAVAAVIAAGIIPAGMEMMDRPAIHAAEDFIGDFRRRWGIQAPLAIDRGDLLRQVMLETSTTQTTLSRISGVHQPSISQFLSGKVDLSDEQLERMVDKIAAAAQRDSADLSGVTVASGIGVVGAAVSATG